MKRGQRPSVEQVVPMLRQIEVQPAQGKSIAVACKEADVSKQSYYTAGAMSTVAPKSTRPGR